MRVHDIGEGEDGFWDDPIATSIACGACHNVKLDIDGDGLAPDTERMLQRRQVALSRREVELAEAALPALVAASPAMASSPCSLPSWT